MDKGNLHDLSENMNRRHKAAQVGLGREGRREGRREGGREGGRKRSLRVLNTGCVTCPDPFSPPPVLPSLPPFLRMRAGGLQPSTPSFSSRRTRQMPKMPTSCAF